jgi:hypothetical protein
MASLRARLLVAVLAITAVALLLLGGITYVEQRSFELDRVDQAARPGGPARRAPGGPAATRSSSRASTPGAARRPGTAGRRGRASGSCPGPTARCATPTGT